MEVNFYRKIDKLFFARPPDLKTRIALIIHPNAAIVDQWGPVLLLLKKNNPHLSVYGLVIKPPSAVGFRKKESSTRAEVLCDVICDQIIYYYPVYVYVPKKFFRFIEIILQKLFKKKYSMNLMSLLFNKLKSINREKKIASIGFDAVLLDGYYLDVKEVQAIVESPNVKLAASLPHGKGYTANNHNLTGAREVVMADTNTLLMVFGEKNIHPLSYLKKNVKNLAFFAYGNPKYDVVGAKEVERCLPAIRFGKKQKYIYLTSRPSSDFLFSWRDKYTAFNDILFYCSKKNYGLVVALHPKEDPAELRKMIKQSSKYQEKDDVILSSALPLNQMIESEFCVHFSVSMCYDSAYLNVPSVLYRPLASRSHWEWGFSRGAVNISEAEHYGLTKTAYDTRTFLREVERLDEDRSACLSSLKRHSEDFFSDFDSTISARLIASEIENAIFSQTS